MAGKAGSRKKKTAAAKPAAVKEADRIFAERLGRHHDELRWLYMELYGNDAMFAELCEQMKRYYDQRNAKLKKLDREREAAGAWYRKRDMLGMMLYVDQFAGTLKGVQEKLDYIRRCKRAFRPLLHEDAAFYYLRGAQILRAQLFLGIFRKLVLILGSAVQLPYLIGAGVKFRHQAFNGIFLLVILFNLTYSCHCNSPIRLYRLYPLRPCS